MTKYIITEPQSNDIKPDLDFEIHYKSMPNFFRKSCRFDFEDEWNNLGYGRIPNNNSKFSISTMSTSNLNFTEVLATVKFENGATLPYVAIIEDNDTATLWINREKGLFDGVDHFLIEDFLTNYKIDKFDSIPVILEIPFGYRSASTMRIDCDENIASGRDLFEIYRNNSVPFSLAIKTDQVFTKGAIKLINDVLKYNGSIVSHSHTHAPNWGGTAKKAKWEAQKAKSVLKQYLPKGYSYEWVVSPFHQNPRSAIRGLEDAGIKGFIGGIIKNDPDYLQSRAGYVSTGENIITHSQQCMLHGDCYHSTGLSIYKQSFEHHYKTNTFFGFLDHPFSNYKYGWNTEEERLNVHEEFLKFIKGFDGVWFANIIQAMEFLWVKANTKIWVENDQLKWSLPEHNYNIPSLQAKWNGRTYEIK